MLCCENSENKIKAKYPKGFKVLGRKKSKNKKEKLPNDTNMNTKKINFIVVRELRKQNKGRTPKKMKAL